MAHRKTRVLWISFDFPPRLSSGVFRTIKLYKYLDKNSFEVDFVTHGRARRLRQAVVDDSLTADLHPAPRVVRVPTPILHDMIPAVAAWLRNRRATPRADDQATARARREASAPPEVEGASVPEPALGFGSRIYRQFAMLLYFPDHLFLWGWLAAVASVWLHARNRYDVVYTTSYPESAHLPGLVLRLFGVRWVADYRYGGPLWIKKLAGYRKSPFRERIDLRFQAYVLRRADRIIVQSEPIRADFIRAFSLDPKRLHALPNGYDEQDFATGDTAGPSFTKRDNEIHLVHVGAMEGVSAHERPQLVDALNRLADRLQQRGRKLVVQAVGSDLFGDERRRNVAHFQYRHYGVILHRNLLPFLHSADCFLLSTITTAAGTDAVKGFIPGKLWEYLRADRPIILVGPKDEAWQIVESVDAGLHLGLNGGGTISAETLIGRITTRRPLHPNIRGYSWESRAHSFQDVLLRVVDAADGGMGRAENHA